MRIKDWYWEDYDNADSTNNKAIELSSNPPSEKYIVSAKYQTSGRGRRGRTWESLSGNLFVSFAVKDAENKLLNRLPFIFSLSVLESIKQLSPDLPISLKWPNDVLISERKVSGILLEKADNGYIIIGVGINLVSAPTIAERITYPATSLYDFGIHIDREQFLKLMVKYLDKNISSGFKSVIDCWLSYAHKLGQELYICTEHHTQHGRFAGVGSNGALLLEQDDKIIKIYAGDVFMKE